MRTKLVVALAFACGIFSGQANAFSENGHQTVGAIADVLLQGSRAEIEVKNILGTVNGQPLTLQQVSVWPDCVRGIKPDENFAYNPGKYRVQACAIFEDDAGQQAMAEYVKRNNTNCEYSGKNFECHKSFHFANIDLIHDDYKETYVGANNHDIVHAIGAAIAVLNGNPAPAPFQIASKKEALALLTHLIGDIHQPLHVGTVYLDADGSTVDPDPGAYDKATDTFGGNAIVGTGGNLHHQWDSTKFSLTDPATINTLAAQAKNIGTPDGSYDIWATQWAGDTIMVAQEAYADLAFNAKTDRTWPVTFDDRRSYVHQMSSIQRQQVVKAGGRLAKLLKAIWPD